MAGTDWMKQAACIGHDHLDWFDIDCNLQQTLQICYQCDVKSQCLELAITNRLTEGVWGGMYGKQLHEMIYEHRGTDASLND